MPIYLCQSCVELVDLGLYRRHHRGISALLSIFQGLRQPVVGHLIKEGTVGETCVHQNGSSLEFIPEHGIGSRVSLGTSPGSYGPSLKDGVGRQIHRIVQRKIGWVGDAAINERPKGGDDLLAPDLQVFWGRFMLRHGYILA